MDPQLQALGVQLADVAVRNTASGIADRIASARARRRNEETIAELEEIVSRLVDDKSELVRIAQAYEHELVAQRIAPSDIEYISASLLPVLQRLIESDPADPAVPQPMIDALQTVLSVETVTVLQLIGFNFRKAIGEPLTRLVAQLIESKSPPPSTSADVQALALQRELAYLRIAEDPEAFDRLVQLTGQG